MMQKLSELISTMVTIWRDPTPSEDIVQDCRAKRRVALFLMTISALLTVMNIVNQWYFMAETTGVLVLGFGMAGYLAEIKKQPYACSVIMAVMVALMFSVYVVTGENEGFASLWVLLVPVLAMNLIGLKTGIILSLYFQLFLVALFYTPLRSIIEGYYTATFLARFPILFFASFGGTAILAFQKQFYIRKTQLQAFYDVTTGLNNRLAYIRKLKNSEDSMYLNVGIFDLNCLKTVNDTHGHNAGDEIIRGVADCLRIAFPESVFTARIGGDEYAVISEEPQKQIWEAQLDAFRKAVDEWRGSNNLQLAVAIGTACRGDHPGFTSDELVRLADSTMYQDKADYYDSHGLKRR